MHRRSLLAASLAAAFISRPGVARANRASTGYIRTNWSRDPFSFGSYSFIAKGSKKRHTADLGRPVSDRLFFAGEATHPSYNSTVHAAFESGQFAADAVAETDAKRVAIIGAGVAGLTAATQLWNADVDVTVYEARDRIGGRIWTDRRLGVPLDLGASWIHGNNGNPLIALTDLLGMETKITEESYVMRGGDGRRMEDREEPDWLEEVVSIQQSAGASLDDINTWAYLRDLDYDGDDVLIPGGYAQMFAAVPDAVEIRLNHQIARIETSASGTAVAVSSGATKRFDAAIVTVPLGVLKSGAITFDPPLPTQKQTAINSLRMGLLDKVYLRFDQVFWDRDATWIITPENGLPPGQFNQWLNLYPYLREPIILAFNGAQPARDLADLSDEDMVARAEQTLSLAYPG